MLIPLLFLISIDAFANDVDYYYSTQNAKTLTTKSKDGIEALYDCSIRVGKRFGDNKYLVNSYGINADKGIVFFQGREEGKLGLYFLREGEVEFVPYSSGASGEIDVFPIPKDESIKIGILKKEGHHLVGSSDSFKNSTEFPRPQYPSGPYPERPKTAKIGPELYESVTGGLSSALDNYCVMFSEKKKEDEKKHNREYNDLLDFGALQTCRFALKRTGHNGLVNKIENIITSCLKTALDPVSKEKKDDKLKDGSGNKESVGK